MSEFKGVSAVEYLIEHLKETYHLTEETLYEFQKAKKIHEEQMIDFHVSVMKKGLIEEGDRQWTDCYSPKIKEVAEQYYNETYGKKD
jgi:hypothetical protein